MKDISVCFIEDTPSYGGGQEWLVDTARELKALKHEFNLLVPVNNSILIKKCSEIGANIFTYNWFDIQQNKEDYKKSWLNAIKRSCIAICSVHPPRGDFHCISFAAECIKETGNHTVLVPKTGTIVPEYIREYYIPDPDVKIEIVTITEFTKNHLVENYKIPDNQVEVIYQGTNTEKFISSNDTVEESSKRYPIKKKKCPVLGTVGMFEERKGHTTLIEAVKHLKETTMPDIRVMFVGKGPEEEKLKAKVKELGLVENIHFYPYTDEPHYIYEQLDILVLPSHRKEGLPNVILESMSMGVPCIASKVAGTPEVVIDEKTGFLVEPGCSESLANRIHHLWDQKEKLKDFSDNSKNMIHNNFNRKSQAVKYSDHFRKIKTKHQKDSS